MGGGGGCQGSCLTFLVSSWTKARTTTSLFQNKICDFLTTFRSEWLKGTCSLFQTNEQNICYQP